jgi:hypothetical protein
MARFVAFNASRNNLNEALVSASMGAKVDVSA